VTTGISGSSLCLVGPGRAGKAFARSWLEAGGSIAGILARTPADARKEAEAIGAGTPGGVLESDVVACDVLVLAVPDDAVASTAAALAGRTRCRTAFHLAGALPAAAIGPLKSSGAALGSIHPARVFTGSAGETWRGALVAIEGEPRAVSEAQSIVRALEARPHSITSASKPLYHAAATLAAGGTVALISFATRAWAQAGIPEQEARPALAALAEQAAEAAGGRGIAGAFTGPVARRDLGTLAAHVAALASRPDLLRLYELLASETLRRTPERGREEEVRRLLDSIRPQKKAEQEP
jgi:predicted short-subunit dehydrogenase-like oxidoreductase (DUF2520 family)